ncbi:matrilin-1-like [Babylonia areolata]|uniref:matrilin-1-like n=1 Tax=Babylonia areolata TaxID=304850 RepID=UPI003FD04CA7
MAAASVPVPADIVFIMDASGSVGSSNFEVMKQFVRDLVDGFEIGSNKIRVGVQKYSSGTNTEFTLSQYTDKNSMKSRIMSIVFTGGGTNTGGALQYMRNTMFSAANGDRSGVPDICVVLTDGRSNSYSLTASEASLSRNAGITIFSIGIGSGIPVTELNEMATDPDADHVFSVSGFSGLSGIMTAFHSQACVPPSAGSMTRLLA